MFTGIVEEMGEVVSCKTRDDMTLWDGWGLSRVSFVSHFLDEIVGTGYGDPLYYPTSVANREHVDILTYVNRFLLLIRTFPCKGALSVSMASV